MDAIIKRCGILCILCLIPTAVPAATFKTANFVVTASSDDIARRVANCAEYWRRDLAVQWLGKPLPNWYHPCPISVQAGQMGAGGQTTFTFENGEVYGWKMQVQGTLERILDSVIPHEVNHTIFASHFRRPLPRWADEGAATLFEHESEQARQMQLLNRVLHTSKRIPLKDLLAIREYPQDMQDVLTLYAEGYSLAGFLVGSKGEQGRHVYLQFLEDANKIGWEKAIQHHYGFDSVALLEQQWTKWIVAGSPPLQPAGVQLASAEESADESDAPQTAMADTSAAPAEQELVIRSQSPSENELNASVPAIDRAPAALPSIPRQLRAARTHDSDQAGSSPSVERGLAGDSTSPERFQPRALRQGSSTAGQTQLSPTADGIRTDPQAKHYQFPEARR